MPSEKIRKDICQIHRWKGSISIKTLKNCVNYINLCYVQIEVRRNVSTGWRLKASLTNFYNETERLQTPRFIWIRDECMNVRYQNAGSSYLVSGVIFVLWYWYRWWAVTSCMCNHGTTLGFAVLTVTLLANHSTVLFEVWTGGRVT